MRFKEIPKDCDVKTQSESMRPFKVGTNFGHRVLLLTVLSYIHTVSYWLLAKCSVQHSE